MTATPAGSPPAGLAEVTPEEASLDRARLRRGPPRRERARRPPARGPHVATEQVLLALFVVVPLLAVLAAVPVAWGWGLGWTDVAARRGVLRQSPASASPSASTATSPTAPSRPTRPLRIALAVAGSMAIEGPVIRWVADHRRHHAFSDREGDPHSPWRYGAGSAGAGARGCGTRTSAGCSTSSRPRSTSTHPTCSRTTTSQRVSRAFPWIVAASLLLPGGARRTAHLVVVGRAHGVLLGRARARRAAAPRHLVDQLGLPRVGEHTRSTRATTRATSGGSAVLSASASPGTTCTTPTRPARATACCAARSTRAPA